jgi:peptidyl-prolyl cis-trans isomerase D
MLRGLRKASSNWLGKAVMAAVVGFLVISFAVWGIGDIFHGFGRSTAIKVGRTEIGTEQFRALYNERLQQFSRQIGRPISMDQARALGLDRLILGQLFAEFTLDEAARRLGLNLSDAEVARQIRSDPAFAGPNGQFDRFRFEQMIRNMGYTEARFVAEQRSRLLRRELAGTITTGMSAPKALVEAADRYQNETRAIEYVLFDRAQAGEIPAPAPEVLAKYFEDHKILFRAPEYRKVVIVSLIPSELARWIEISDADLERAYNERRSKYVVAERRHIEQIDFPNAAAAEAAVQRIAQGVPFVDIAKELGKTEKDIDLGTVTKGEMIDRAVADAAFALKEGEVSAPVQGRFGTVLLRVVKIEPEQAKPLQEVAGELKQELALARAKSQILSSYDKIEDARSEGKSLAEAAENLKLPARTIEAIDRSGRDPSGTPVELPDPQRLLDGIFTTEVGIERDPLQVQDGYIWYDVLGITPSHERSLEEVKDKVEQRWREQEIAAKLNTKATEFFDKVKAGTPLAEAAVAEHLKAEKAEGIKRGASSTQLSPAGVDAVFRTTKDQIGKADAAHSPEQIVFRVTEITVPTIDMNSDDTKRIVETLNRGISEELFGEYVARIQNEIGVTLNQAVLRQVISGSASSGDSD